MHSPVSRPLTTWGEQQTRGDAGPTGRLLFAAPNAFFKSGVRRYRSWYLVQEGDLLSAIRRSQARHVVLGPTRLFVSIYLDAVPWAEWRYRNADVAVYRLTREAVAPRQDWTLVSSNEAPDIVAHYEDQFPDEFSRFEQHLASFGLTGQDVSDTTYARHQIDWVRRHIDPTSKIMYASPLGEFMVPEWTASVGWFNTDRSLQSLPEVAILGLSRAAPSPVYVNDRFEARPILPLSLWYDHRLIDGADGVRFLRWIANRLEHPLLLEL